MISWIALLMIFIIELFCYTWCRVQCIRTGYEISKEKNNQKRLIAMQKNLKIELARLKSPNRIEKIAKNQLGLIAPKPDQMLIIP